MFDIGIQELIMIFVVALLVVGPKKLPELGKSLGKILGELKRSFDGVKDQVNSELEEVEKETKQNALLDPEPARKIAGRRSGRNKAAGRSEESRKDERAE